MKITVRKKKLANGRVSLYLDIYAPETGKSRYKEYLRLYLFARPATKDEREVNKKTELLAENIRSKRLLDLQNTTHGFPVELQKHGNFITYFSGLAEKRKESLGNYGNWNSVYNHLEKHSGKNLPFAQINAQWLEGFKQYLDHTARMKNGKKLSQNSKYSYFNKVVAALKQAVKDRMLAENPANQVKAFAQGETQREFLTLEELRKAAKAECDSPLLRQAFLFSALTGLRWGDICKLTWSQIQFAEKNGWYIRFTQRKTKGVETLPVPAQAIELLGDRQEPGSPVFPNLKYNSNENLKLTQWLLRAGITKYITFHCARHTYATLQLTFGVDIFTVSKLLGHRHLSTTTIYAKVIDQKKIEAANKIPNLL